MKCYPTESDGNTILHLAPAPSVVLFARAKNEFLRHLKSNETIRRDVINR